MLTLSDKICLVTGANSGIGYAAALHFAGLGAQVIMICRNEVKGSEAVRRIEKATGHAPELLLADLSSVHQTTRVADEIVQRYDQLDILFNNAGGYFPHRRESVEGVEFNFALNHLGYFTLTLGLLPLLEKTSGSRVVNVASRAHRMARLDFSDLEWHRRRYIPFVAYGTSKLMNILFTRMLAERIGAAGPTVNCYHPGVVRTGFGQDFGGLFNLGTRLGGLFFLSPAQGADTGIYLATSSEVAVVSGQYFSKRKVTSPRPAGRSDENARRLWALSEEYLARLA
ncbi:MAG: SDR family NAD(P)-dependent oxidoreductase [Myxococcota bacterium]|nr:SDR family NAD(P)-dependent oxidoreductase [Myxococcota bacterium]